MSPNLELAMRSRDKAMHTHLILPRARRAYVRRAQRVPRTAGWLGFAGVLPFVACAAAVGLGNGAVPRAASVMLLGYGAVILAFLGAVHWGIGLGLDGPQRSRALLWSVSPALLAWAALALPTPTALFALGVGFTATYVWDRGAANRGHVPAWYARLRRPLTFAVVGCLVAAALMIDAEQAPRGLAYSVR